MSSVQVLCIAPANPRRRSNQQAECCLKTLVSFLFCITKQIKYFENYLGKGGRLTRFKELFCLLIFSAESRMH